MLTANKVPMFSEDDNKSCSKFLSVHDLGRAKKKQAVFLPARLIWHRIMASVI